MLLEFFFDIFFCIFVFDIYSHSLSCFSKPKRKRKNEKEKLKFIKKFLIGFLFDIFESFNICVGCPETNAKDFVKKNLGELVQFSCRSRADENRSREKKGFSNNRKMNVFSCFKFELNEESIRNSIFR